MEFKKYFNSNITFEKTNKGMTNENYLSNNGFIIKKYLNLVKNNEIKVQNLVKEFDVDIHLINKEVKITKFIKDAITLYDVAVDEAKTIKIAKMIRKLHTKALKSNIIFKPDKIIYDYLKGVKKPMYDYHKYMFLINEIKNIYCKEKDMVLCHNDLSPGNFLFVKDKLYLIDWEYAGMNDPIFDVVSFLNENNLYETNYKNIFLKEYFKGEEFDINKLNLWNDFQNLMWCIWANMMFDSKPNKIYIEIAENKMTKLKRSLNG